MQVPPDVCAHEILEVIPLVMRVIRSEMRQRRAEGLTVPQFRALLYVDRMPGASLSEVAEYLGLTLPSTSTLVDGLVARELLLRQSAQEDRRRMTLNLTIEGKSQLEAAQEGTQRQLVERISGLSDDDRGKIVDVMRLLRPLFTSCEELDGVK